MLTASPEPVDVAVSTFQPTWFPLMGGDITARNHPGDGAEFEIHFPAVSVLHDPEPSQQSRERRPSRRPVTI